MPQYSYVCSNCEGKITIVQAFTEESLGDCPHCWGTLRKLFSPPVIKFNGSGFYSTDKEKV